MDGDKSTPDLNVCLTTNKLKRTYFVVNWNVLFDLIVPFQSASKQRKMLKSCCVVWYPVNKNKLYCFLFVCFLLLLSVIIKKEKKKRLTLTVRVSVVFGQRLPYGFSNVFYWCLKQNKQSGATTQIPAWELELLKREHIWPLDFSSCFRLCVLHWNNRLKCVANSQHSKLGLYQITILNYLPFTTYFSMLIFSNKGQHTEFVLLYMKCMSNRMKGSFLTFSTSMSVLCVAQSCCEVSLCLSVQKRKTLFW